MADSGRTQPSLPTKLTPSFPNYPAVSTTAAAAAPASLEAASIARVASRRLERAHRDGAAWQSALRMGVETLAALTVVDHGAGGAGGLR
jgi:hypothetical protein